VAVPQIPHVGQSIADQNRPGFDAHSFLGRLCVVPNKYDPETRAKAVRLVLDHRDDYPSEWAAIRAVSSRLGMNPETLRNWIRQQQVDDECRDGVTSEAAAEIRGDGPSNYGTNERKQ
jgi:transposase